MAVKNTHLLSSFFILFHHPARSMQQIAAAVHMTRVATLSDRSHAPTMYAGRAISLAYLFHHALAIGTMERCTHTNQMKKIEPRTSGCEECLRLGDSWVHLRLCMSCGHVGCCNSSKNKHATKHFHATSHPIVRSIEQGERWRWCYVDELFME